MRSGAPHSKFSQEAWATASGPRARSTPPELRATLDGLEVRPVSFDDWLSAGGERRRKPRGPAPGSARR